jgi:radical SAM superfamily enzyme YgiQ (UPF0313 family)
MSDVVILSGTLFDNPMPSRPLAQDSDYRAMFRTAGPYAIAHYLRKNNISVQVIDYLQSLTDKQIVFFLKKFLPKDKKKTCILGISTTFFQITGKKLPEYILNAIETVKSEYKNLKIVAGGSSVQKLSMKDNHIDYAMYSYSEDAALELFNGILGRTTIDHRFKINKAFTQDNVNFDIVQSDFRFIKEDCIRPKEALPLEISRGCIFKCKFCRFPHIGKKKNDYIRCIDQIRAELIYNYETFGTTNYYVLDDTFNETPEKVKEFYDMTQTLPFKINWCGYLRVDLIHRFPETAVWLKDSGLVGAFFGIESFHPKASALVGKSWSGKHGKDYILELKKKIWSDDVTISISLILGIPPETWEDILETQKWLVDNNMDSWGWHALAINSSPVKFDKSEFEKDPEKYGLTFPDPKNPNYWEHEFITKKEVDQWYKDIKTLYPPAPKAGAWEVIELLNYFDKKVAMSANFQQNYFEEMKYNREKWTRLYFKMLQDLPDAD